MQQHGAHGVHTQHGWKVQQPGNMLAAIVAATDTGSGARRCKYLGQKLIADVQRGFLCLVGDTLPSCSPVCRLLIAAFAFAAAAAAGRWS
jgi:hypothetical protein